MIELTPPSTEANGTLVSWKGRAMTAIAVTTRYVYDFDDAAPGGRTQLGGKGLGLAEMTHMGLPVPRGFTVTGRAGRRTG